MKKTVIKLSLFLVIPLLVVFSLNSALAVSITGCTIISQPGYYTLDNDLLNAYSSIQYGQTCISIQSSNVILVGNGHKISRGTGQVLNGLSIQVPGNPFFILNNITVRNFTFENVTLFSSDSSNVTLSNLNFKYYTGIYAGNINGYKIVNNTFNYVENGIQVNIFSNVLVEGNKIYNSTLRGIDVVGTRYSNTAPKGDITIRRNVIEDSNISMELYYVYNGIVQNNTFKNNWYGLFVSMGSYNNTISANSITDIDQIAIALYSNTNSSCGNNISGNFGTNNVYNLFPDLAGCNIYFNNFPNGALYHAADLNKNWAINLNEFTNYSSYFKLGKNWPGLAGVPDIDNYSRSYFLLKRGTVSEGPYQFNSSATSCPLCWIVR